MICDYSGSYYDPSPWTEHACTAQYEVPAGCPIDVVTANDPTLFTVSRGGADVASSSTVVDTVTQTFTIPDEFSCDCAPTDIAVGFHRVAITVPDAAAGDVLTVGMGGDRFDFSIVAAAPCVTAWPDGYTVALACDRCPTDMPTDGGPGATTPTSTPGGCQSSPSPALALGLLVLIARRGRSRGAAAPR